jgi:uncharacterized protein YggE
MMEQGGILLAGKKLLLIAMFAIPSFLFSYEIAFNKNFSKKLKGDVITTSVNINIEDKKEKVINRKIEKFNRFFKQEKSLTKKGGSFSLNPRYKYYNNKQVFLKYVGSLRYSLESKNAQDLNSFVQKLIDYKEALDDENIKLSISSISWQVSKKQQEFIMDKLKLSSIKWAESYAKKLSRELNQDCEIKNININTRFTNPIPMHRKMAMSVSSLEKSAAVSPLNTNKELNLSANYKMECK